MQVLCTELPKIEITVSSENSPDLAASLIRGTLDVAFLRAERNRPELDHITVTKEPFVVVMPSDHRLAKAERVDVRELAGELFNRAGAPRP